MQKRKKKVEFNGERKSQRSRMIIVARQKAMRDAGRKYISPPLCPWISYFSRVFRVFFFIMFPPFYFELNYFGLLSGSIAIPSCAWCHESPLPRQPSPDCSFLTEIVLIDDLSGCSFTQWSYLRHPERGDN